MELTDEQAELAEDAVDALYMARVRLPFLFASHLAVVSPITTETAQWVVEALPYMDLPAENGWKEFPINTSEMLGDLVIVGVLRFCEGSAGEYEFVEGTQPLLSEAVRGSDAWKLIRIIWNRLSEVPFEHAIETVKRSSPLDTEHRALIKMMEQF